MSDLFGNYAAYILGAMGAALFFMLLEPILLVFKRRAVLQNVIRVKRQEERRNRKQ